MLVDIAAGRLPVENRDVPGKDPRDVPRYPGSWRIFFKESAGDFMVAAYQADCAAEKADDFMTDGMLQRGWAPIANDTDSSMLLFAKQSREAQVLAEIFIEPVEGGRSVINVIVQRISE
ncbi:MAG: hypothetical protein ACYC1U_06610 [Candidatus Aquicultorales bacterium]